MVLRCQPQSRAKGVPVLTSHSRLRPIRDAMKELLCCVTRICAKDWSTSAAKARGTQKVSGPNRMFRQRFGGPGETILREALEGSLLLFDPGATFYATWRETQVFSARRAARTSEGECNDSHFGPCGPVSPRSNHVHQCLRGLQVRNPGSHA